jgi:NADPH:quinone reductase-like Zn-dependent oxidoreductase
MWAVSQRAFGGPEALEIVEVPRPTPGPGEALIRVHAASVNAADWKHRSGLLRRFGDPPFTVGLDFSGLVEALDGPTTRVRPGDPVYGLVLPPAGSHAQYVVAPVDALAPAPRRIDLVSAAALPVAALTAWQPLVRVADVGTGDRVLIHAAAGGIGHLAV